MADLDAASLEDARAFYSTWYAPDNAVLSIVGDVEAATTLAAVERYFGGIPAKGSFPEPPPTDIELSGSPTPSTPVTAPINSQGDGTLTYTFAATVNTTITWKLQPPSTNSRQSAAAVVSPGQRRDVFDGDWGDKPVVGGRELARGHDP